MVVAGGVDGEFADDLAGLGVDDGDVVVLDEHGDAGSLGGSADADVVETAVESQGDVAGFVDPVGTDALVGLGCGVRGGFGAEGIDGCWCCPVGQGPVGALVVVVGCEGGQEFVELGQGGRLVGLSA